ncbi:universal stress protein [Streptomyces sp. NPDC005727]|uniref:universal stress protein n=1 Tax=Streptomyces sp. NPDC005727 TaxID=3157053 RepID=UPI00340A1274
MPRTITVGVGGSPGSLAAADWAAHEAHRRDVPLRLVHATQRAAAEDGALTEAVARITRRHPGLSVDAGRVAAEPVSALLRAAEDAELVVLGPPGAGGIGGLPGGSVALAVVTRSRRPVVLVPGGHRPDEDRAGARGATTTAEVVVGLELTDPHDAVLEFAFDAADRRATGLRVVHGRREPDAHDPGADAGAVPGAEMTAVPGGHVLPDVLRTWQEKFPGVEVAEQAVIGTAGTHLAEASGDASLVVVGHAGRRTPLGRAVGPVTRALLHHGSAPVGVVPHG